MSSVIDLYERLSTAEDDKTRARIVAEAFEALEDRYPHLSETATRTDLSETELRLIKEIEQVRSETEKIRAELSETELRLMKEIEQVRSETEKIRAELSETELRLMKEIEQVRSETEKIRAELSETELRLMKEIEQVRSDLKVEIEQVRSDLKVEIEKVRGDVRVEIARGHAAWLKWSFLFWLTQFSAILLLLWRLWPQG